MSIEANTFERITIDNTNAKAKAVAEAFGEYLLKTWGIHSLSMIADGREYQSKADTVSENAELADVCRRLGEAKRIEASLRSTNAGGLDWRLESCFLSLLTNDEDLKSCVTYKSTDYYDQGENVDLYRFGENGPERLECDQTEMTFSDVQSWYCYTPQIDFYCDNGFADDVFNTVNGILLKLATEYFDRDEDLVDADEHELNIGFSVDFKTEDIPVIVNMLQQAVDAAKGTDGARCEIDINAVPGGKDDYDFASVRFWLEEGQVKVGYCRF